MTKPKPGARRGRPPGFAGQSNRNIEYSCTACGKEFTKDTLFAKRVMFAILGRNKGVVRSRTVAWLCEPCMNADPDYAREMYASSPGMKDTSLAQPKE